MLDQELEVSVRARRGACVVDPLLAFCHPLGAQLVQRLATVVELWMVRTFWQVLDSSEFYRRDPLAFWPAAARGRLPADGGERIAQALRFWEGVRARNDMVGSGLHWVSDNLSESALPDGVPGNLVERYEALHQGLGQRVDPHDEAAETAGFYGAMDTLALAAALGAARVLTLAPTDPRACLPGACGLLRLPFVHAPASDRRLRAAERRMHADLVMRAGATALAWAGPPTALAWTVLPCAALQVVEADDYVHRPVLDALPQEYAIEYAPEPCPAAAASDLWQDAQVFHQATE